MALRDGILVHALLDELVRKPSEDGADEAADEHRAGLSLVEVVHLGKDVRHRADVQEDDYACRWSGI